MKTEIRIIRTLSYIFIVLAVIGYFIFPYLIPLLFLELVVDAVVMTRLFGSWFDD